VRSPTRRRQPSPRRAVRFGLLALAALLLGGCSVLLESSPEPSPADFPGIASELANHGLVLDAFTSGDAGCDDPTLAPTAIGFDASGLGIDEPTHLRVYIFRNGETYERRAADVDACAQQWATDPATFEIVNAKPFVLAGQGPWPPAFEEAVRESLQIAAGNGG
jgi:hypothetical protein